MRVTAIIARLVVLLTLAASLPVFAQTQAINGSMRGRVIDQAGAPIPAATVKIDNVETGFSRTIETAADGYYVLPNLPIGTYSVTISKPGFTTQQHTGIVLDAGMEAVIEAQLTVGETTTTIEVTGGAPVVDPSRTDIGRTISYREVANLPLTSRNPYNFVLFQPGISGHPNPELGIPRTINTNGLLDRINYQMDGMVDTESDRYGLRLLPIADIYVGEIQTVSNSFAPEFGGTSGDIYNVITGSGTNDFHGEFQYIGRPVDWQARSILLASNKPPADLTLNDESVNAGGRLIKDKLFLFGAYEHITRGLPSPNTIDPNQAAQIGIPSSLLATAPTVQHAQFFDTRLDWQATNNERIFVRYNYFRNQYPFNTQVGGKNALDAAADFRDRAHVGGLQILSTFSPTLLNELRFSWPYRNEAHVADPLTGPGPVINISGIATFNGSSSTGDKFAEKIPSLNDNVSFIHGAHTLKFGGGFERILDNQIGDTYSQYNFASIAAYLSAQSGANPYAYSNFITIIGTPGASYYSLFWNVFAQDTWQVRPNVLVTYGVRYDKFQSPDAAANEPFIYSRSFRTPGANWSPRLGLAWSITPKTVLRVNSGIFYEAPPTNLWFNALTNNGGTQSFQDTLNPTSPGAPAFPNVPVLAGATLPGTPSITAVTPNYKNAYTYNSSFQISQQITNNDALTVGYVSTLARNQTYLRNMNLINPIRYLADGRPVYSSAINSATRLYPQFNNITLQDIGAIADYNAMLVTWTHRLAQGIEGSVNYTWSHSISDAPDANSFEQNLPIENNISRQQDRGNSIINRPQALTISSVMAPTFNLSNRIAKYLANNNQLALLTQLSSGDEQNITANTTLNGDSTTSSVTRPLYVGRYTARGPNIYQVDIRYTRTIFTLFEKYQPKFIFEVNNLLNVHNITSLNTVVPVNSTTGLPLNPIPTSFQPLSTVLEARILQLGVRLDW